MGDIVNAVSHVVSDISNEASRFEKSTIRPVIQTVANPMFVMASAVLGPVAVVLTGALSQDQQQSQVVDTAAKDNSSQVAAVDQQTAEVDKAIADAQSASDAADAAAAQAAADAQAAQAAYAAEPTPDQAAAAAALDTGAGIPAGMPSGGGGGGMVTSVPDVSSIEAAEAPPFEMPTSFDTGAMAPQPSAFDTGMPQQTFGPTPDAGNVPLNLEEMYAIPTFQPDEWMPEISAVQMSPELQELVEAPFAPDFSEEEMMGDQTLQLSMSQADELGPDQFGPGDQVDADVEAANPFSGHNGFGRIINMQEAEGIEFSKIPRAMFEPPLSYDDENAPKYKESGALLPVGNRLNSRIDLPNTKGFPIRRDMDPSYNNPMFAMQDIPDAVPSHEVDYHTQGGGVALPIKRGELPLSMPINANFGTDVNRPSSFDFMIKDLRSLQSHLEQLIKNAETFVAYNQKFSGMMNMATTLAPVRKELSRMNDAVKYIKKSRSKIKPRTAEEHEKSRLTKKMVDDMLDDIKTLTKTIEQVGV